LPTRLMLSRTVGVAHSRPAVDVALPQLDEHSPSVDQSSCSSREAGISTRILGSLEGGPPNEAHRVVLATDVALLARTQ
jgi:hypothetical protein